MSLQQLATVNLTTYWELIINFLSCFHSLIMALIGLDVAGMGLYVSI